MKHVVILASIKSQKHFTKKTLSYAGLCMQQASD